MIANDKETPFEIAVKMITAPIWVPIYFAGVGVLKLGKAWSRRKPKRVEPEILAPVQPAPGCQRGTSSVRCTPH
jgi:hypothetical protein